MKVVDGIVMRVAPWALPALTVGIFLIDLFTPVGVAVSALYIIPLLLTFLSKRDRDPMYFCALASVLLWLNLFLKPEGTLIQYGVLNRIVGMLILWVVTAGLVRYKRTQAQLATVELSQAKAMHELMSERVERAHAEGLMMAAQEARALAETAVLGATAVRREAEEKYLLGQLWLEGIIQCAMDAVITVDQDQKVVLFNQAAEQMFGCRAEEALGRPIDRFIPQQHRQAHHEHIKQFGKTGVTNRKMGALGSITGLRSTGEEFPIEAAISQLRFEGRQFFTVILRDVTEWKRVERLVRQSEERYRRLIAVSPYAVLVNRGDRVIFANDQAIKLFGAVKADELLERSPLSLFHPDCRSAIRERMHEVLEEGQLLPMVEERIVTLDGAVIDVEFSATRFTDDEGPAVLVMLRDISERKNLQEQLRKTERIAELGTLASGMAHEIGTPMNVILGRAEYLMDRVTDAPIKKGLQTIVTQVERITRVMNQLLSFARRQPPERRALDLRDIIETSLEIFEERLTKNRIHIETVLDQHCPVVRADADQISQVLINLIVNAIHAMPDGGLLRIGLSPEREMVKLRVADTGHGIPGEAMTKIFEPFFTTKEFGKGTGLGLTVVKGIVEEHHGSIEVESEQGKGTTFTILLPQFQSNPPE